MLASDLLSVRHTYKKEERHYYEGLLRYSREHLMLYPYHLSDVMVKGLRITPFAYYVNTMMDIMNQEKSYDSLPNFTAADCKCTVLHLHSNTSQTSSTKLYFDFFALPFNLIFF